jgi:predicted TIM-barrel fold metal-dependent hydrolase
VVEALRRAQELLDSFDEDIRALLPADAYLFDVHTHLGTDIDGMRGHVDELVAMLDRYGFAGAFSFCLDEPDRHPAFTAANDRTIASAAEAPDRIVPFVRLDLAERPIEEAHRAIDRGARGIKLHLRAQKIALDDPQLDGVWAVAAERAVPILIHGGRGLPPIADHLHELVRRYPEVQLIIAHAGIADMAGLAGYCGGVPNVFFDTSVWSGLDLLDLYRQVSPEQVLYASDYPYGRQPNSLVTALRTATLAGYGEPELRAMLGESARRIAAGEPSLPLTEPRGEAHIEQPLVYARIHSYLSMATPMLWLRQPDGVGALGLALNATLERGNGHRPETERIRELLSAGAELWGTLPHLESDGDIAAATRTAARVIQLADVLAVTTRA